MVPMTVPLASHDDITIANDVTWPKSHTALHLDHLDLRNEIVPLTLSSACHDADSNGITRHQWHHVMLIPMASRDQKCYVVPHFSFVNQRNTVMPLMVLLALCNSDASVNGIK